MDEKHHIQDVDKMFQTLLHIELYLFLILPAEQFIDPVNLKTRGFLTHPNKNLYMILKMIEMCFFLKNTQSHQMYLKIHMKNSLPSSIMALSYVLHEPIIFTDFTVLLSENRQCSFNIQTKNFINGNGLSSRAGQKRYFFPYICIHDLYYDQTSTLLTLETLEDKVWYYRI
ncbi:hypothetical protein AGLY_000023 [Aphis glycines]|uniref:Uncharacterized protein n=1 Tax=Aphis glycines TaxID=307491 RepID=A0A6G0U871_APHGL|nr:hypothetical protein AGLY_000023 [Aphis glycines]